MQLKGDIDQLLRTGRNRRHRRRDADQAAAAASVDESSLLSELLLKITDKRNQELDPGSLRRIKALCKKSGDHIKAVHDYLLHALEVNHAQVRYHAMDVCDQLFQRSHLFRSLVTQHLPQILEHAVGTKASRPLPGPPNVATKLHEKALESIDQWADKYGAYYQQLRVSMRYLRDVLQMRFPQLRARAAAAEAETRAREARAQEVLQEKLTVIVETFDETSADIHSTLDQMAQAFELLTAKPDQALHGARTEPAGDDDGLQWEDVANGAEGGEADEEEELEGLSEYRDTALPEELLGSTSVVQNPDPAVLEILRELNQLLGGSHMRTVNEWLRTLTQVVMGESGSREDRQRQQLLRRATDLRGAITRAQDRYGAVMDALGPLSATSALLPPPQQDTPRPSAAAQKDPKEAMPPWLAQSPSRMKDLFGSSSSDDDQEATGSARQANPGTSWQAVANAAADTEVPITHTAEEEAHLNGQAGRLREVKLALEAGEGAANASASVPRIAPQHGQSKPSEAAKRALIASKVAAHASGSAQQRKQRIDYGAIAERLKRKSFGAAAVEHRRSPGATAEPARPGPPALAHATAVKTQGIQNADSKAGCMSGGPSPSKAVLPITVRKEGHNIDAWEDPVMEEGLTPRIGNSPNNLWDSQAEEGGTIRPRSRQRDLWEGTALNDDDSLASDDDRSAAGDSAQQQDRSAAWGSGKRERETIVVSQAAGTAVPEAKKSKIPESLKQALAAQAPVVPSGPHLAYWDSKDETLVNARGMQVYNHWGPVDEHKTLPAERLNELFGSMATYYRPPTEEELRAAAQRKTEQEKPSFKDEPLETQRVKRAKVPVTPILPPGAARLVAASAATLASADGLHVPELKSIMSASKQAAADEPADAKLQRAAHQWPSHVSDKSAPGSAHLEVERHAHHGSPVLSGAVNDQQIDVDEVKWVPGDARVTPASTGRVGSDSGPAQQVAGAPSLLRGTGIRDPEKTSKGQRALDKAHNDAVLAEAATRDPILAGRWAAQHAGKSEKGRKAQGAKKLGVRASLARKLLSKRAVKSAASDLSLHESEAHKELNTNRWEEI